MMTFDEFMAAIETYGLVRRHKKAWQTVTRIEVNLDQLAEMVDHAVNRALDKEKAFRLHWDKLPSMPAIVRVDNPEDDMAMFLGVMRKKDGSLEVQLFDSLSEYSEEMSEDLIEWMAPAVQIMLLIWSNRPEVFEMSRRQVKEPSEVKRRLGRKGPTTITIRLSAPIVKRIPVDSPMGHNSTGRKMPEHLVKSFQRHYKSGKVVSVRPHKRGDPSIPRKTVYRVIP
jgi:hypothetical protein